MISLLTTVIINLGLGVSVITVNVVFHICMF